MATAEVCSGTNASDVRATFNQNADTKQNGARCTTNTFSNDKTLRSLPSRKTEACAGCKRSWMLRKPLTTHCRHSQLSSGRTPHSGAKGMAYVCSVRLHSSAISVGRKSRPKLPQYTTKALEACCTVAGRSPEPSLTAGEAEQRFLSVMEFRCSTA